jgi:hypothetical protein
MILDYAYLSVPTLKSQLLLILSQVSAQKNEDAVIPGCTLVFLAEEKEHSAALIYYIE